MRSLVVYESMFGNTKDVAFAVADGLKEGGATCVEVVEVDRAPDIVPSDVGLVVVGGPTHAFSMSRPRTREDAEKQGADPEQRSRTGMREWVDTFSADPDLRLAAFDTKVEKVRRLPGSASHQASRRLRHRGFRLAAGPQSFGVDATAGPLVEGDLDRARAWGRQVMAAAIAIRGPVA